MSLGLPDGVGLQVQSCRLSLQSGHKVSRVQAGNKPGHKLAQIGLKHSRQPAPHAVHSQESGQQGPLMMISTQHVGSTCQAGWRISCPVTVKGGLTPAPGA